MVYIMNNTFCFGLYVQISKSWVFLKVKWIYILLNFYATLYKILAFFFSIGLFAFLVLNFESSLYILDTSP